MSSVTPKLDAEARINLDGPTQCIYERDGDLFRIILNRPDQMNSFTPTLYVELKYGLLRATADSDIRIIEISGAGGVFAAGGDLKLFLEILDLPAQEQLVAYTQAFDETIPFQTLLDTPKPVIAKVDGLCLAGGLIVAAAADVVVASTTAVFGVPEGAVGLTDPYCSALLPYAIGLSRARYMMMTGERIDAHTAKEWGLVLEVVEPDELDAAAAALADKFRRTAPESQRSYKLSANAIVPPMDPRKVLEAALTANGREGLAAFSEKRPPVWQSPDGML